MNVAANISIPVFALYVTKDIGAAAASLGVLSATYWIVKSILQLPLARVIDRRRGEIDDYHFLLLGMVITTIGIFLFYWATELLHLLLLQVLIAVGDAFAVPPIYAIFTRHIDSGSEGFEWSLYSSFSLGAGSAIGGLLSAVFVETIGLRPMFLVNGMVMVLGIASLLFLRPYLRPRPARRTHQQQFVEHHRF